MTLLFVSEDGENLGLAMRCVDEGYSVSFYTESEEAAFVGNGIVDKSAFSKHILNCNKECIASNLNQLMEVERPDIVVFDSLHLGKAADYLREKGVSVFGSGRWADTLSNGGSYAKGIMKRVGITPFKKEVGVRVSCGAWWNGFSLLSPYISFNENRELTGSLGRVVKSSGNVSHSVSVKSRIFKESIEKMERLLKKTKFRGNISLSCIATKDRLYGISFLTSSLFLPSLLESYKGSVTELLVSITEGREIKGEFTSDYTLSVPVSIPPRPFDCDCLDVEVGGICPSNLRHLYLTNLKLDGDMYRSARGEGELLVASARGRDVNEAKKRAYKTISNLSIEDVQYRTDIGDRILGSEETLKGWGYLI